jgi:sporulation protein YlmC with PRC-barrel domain
MEVCGLEEGQPIGFRDLLKVEVRDATGRQIGHVQDMALEADLGRVPYIEFLGVHLFWTDRVGDIELVRRAEDLVLLVPWSDVASANKEVITLNSKHPEFPVKTAAGKWLVRKDILDKQMVDPEGSRIHRVDDVVLVLRGGRLKVVGVEVSKGLLLTSSALRRYLAEIRRKHASRSTSEVIPWEAVEGITPDAVVIGEEVPH